MLLSGFNCGLLVNASSKPLAARMPVPKLPCKRVAPNELPLEASRARNASETRGFTFTIELADKNGRDPKESGGNARVRRSSTRSPAFTNHRREGFQRFSTK